MARNKFQRKSAFRFLNRWMAWSKVAYYLEYRGGKIQQALVQKMNSRSAVSNIIYMLKKVFPPFKRSSRSALGSTKLDHKPATSEKCENIGSHLSVRYKKVVTFLYVIRMNFPLVLEQLWL